MNDHPEIRDLFFVRHAPVRKRAGHVPPSDPPVRALDYKLDRVATMLPKGAEWHVSPLQRARQTAAQLEPLLSPLCRTEAVELSEMEFGDWADRPVADVWDEIKSGPLHNWSFLTADTLPPGGESFAMLAERVAGWMETIAFKASPLIIIAHSGVIRAALAHATGMTAEQAVGIPVAHFGILHLRQMDPARALAAGGQWLFAGLSDPKAVPNSPV